MKYLVFFIIKDILFSQTYSGELFSRGLYISFLYEDFLKQVENFLKTSN